MGRILKWGGAAVAAVLGLALLVAVGLFLRGSGLIGETYVLDHGRSIGEEASAPAERGEHLAVAVSRCAVCHGPRLQGRTVIDDPAFGVIPAPNLTSGAGGVGADYEAADWERAIRHGVGRDGRVLVGMPSEFFAAYGNRDLRPLVRYLEALEPVDNELPERSVGLLARALIGAGLYSPPAVALDHEATHATAPPPASTAGYGGYLVAIAACGECHGPDLTGPAIPGPPPGPDLTRSGSLGGWTEADFFRAMRAGTTPDGRRLDPARMPWPSFSGMGDGELRAIWRHLRSLPGDASGGARVEAR